MTRTAAVVETAPLVEYRTVRLVENRISEDGSFSGWANLTGVTDSYGTRFSADAWTAGGLDTGQYALLDMHDPNRRVGVFTASMRTADDGTSGLWIEGRFLDTVRGRDARTEAIAGAAPELSVGFIRLATDPADPSLITAALLKETSLVTVRFASQPGAELASVRTADPAVPVSREQAETEARISAPFTGSYEERQQAVGLAVQGWALGQFGVPSAENDWYAYVEATFADSVIVIVHRWDPAHSRSLFRIGYGTGPAGDVVLGEAEPVTVNVTAEARIAARTAPAPDSAAPDADADAEARTAAALLALHVPGLP